MRDTKEIDQLQDHILELLLDDPRIQNESTEWAYRDIYQRLKKTRDNTRPNEFDELVVMGQMRYLSKVLTNLVGTIL